MTSNENATPCSLWLSFEKEKPPTGKPVLALLSTKQYEVAFAKKVGNYYMWIRCSTHSHVGYAEKSFWMVLPER